MGPISQTIREERLQEVVGYNPCRVEHSAVLRYLLAVRRNSVEQITHFGSLSESVRRIILNIRTYEEGMVFGYVGKRFGKYGWINGMLPIIEEIELSTFNTIHIGQFVDGTCAVAIDWCIGTAGGGSYPSVWGEPARDYKEAVRQGILLSERQYSKAERWPVPDRSSYNPEAIRNLKRKLLEIEREYIQP